MSAAPKLLAIRAAPKHRVVSLTLSDLWRTLTYQILNARYGVWHINHALRAIASTPCPCPDASRVPRSEPPSARTAHRIGRIAKVSDMTTQTTRPDLGAPAALRHRIG